MESRLVGKEAKRRQTFQGKMQIEPGRSFYAIFLFTLKSVMNETKNGKMTGPFWIGAATTFPSFHLIPLWHTQGIRCPTFRPRLSCVSVCVWYYVI